MDQTTLCIVLAVLFALVWTPIAFAAWSILWPFYLAAGAIGAVIALIAVAVKGPLQPTADTAARAEFEHAAIMRGEIGLGTYGAYPPANTHNDE